MPRRTTTGELRTEIHGLALAFFALGGVILDTLNDIVDDEEFFEQAFREATSLLLDLRATPENPYGEEALDNALLALLATFGPRVEINQRDEPEGSASPTEKH